jgi:hypothetical protein
MIVRMLYLTEMFDALSTRRRQLDELLINNGYNFALPFMEHLATYTKLDCLFSFFSCTVSVILY